MQTRPFRRDRDGVVQVHLEGGEASLLVRLLGEFRHFLDGAPSGDPALERLFPHAYVDSTEVQAESEWQALSYPGLLRHRLDALASIEKSISIRGEGKTVDTDFTEERAQCWLGVLNDIRLVWGTRLGIDEETVVENYSEGSPEREAFLIYAWLTYLQGELVETLLDLR